MKSARKVRKRNKRNTYVKTCVKGVRAEEGFWEKCDLVAKSENTTRNELIVSIVSEYCNKKVKNVRK